MINWSIVAAAGGGAAVEFLETAVIAYAIARSGYWREAVWGSLLGTGLVAIAAVPLGVGLQFFPLNWLQIVIGGTLVWFGWRWVRKSVKRVVEGKRAGWMGDDPLMAECITLETQTQGFSWLNFGVMTKSAALEAFEVAIIVVTVGVASRNWAEAIGGAAVAFIAAVLVVAILHSYLKNIPEVLLKLGTGVLLCTLGSFWLGEGLGYEWWLGDWSILVILSVYCLLTAIAIRVGYSQFQREQVLQED